MGIFGACDDSALLLRIMLLETVEILQLVVKTLDLCNQGLLKDEITFVNKSNFGHGNNESETPSSRVAGGCEGYIK